LVEKSYKKSKKTSFLVKKVFFEDERKSTFLSVAGATAFEVSLDGSLTRIFEDMEFTASLPVIRVNAESERKEFLPKRDEDSAKSSSDNDEKTARGEKGKCSKEGAEARQTRVRILKAEMIQLLETMRVLEHELAFSDKLLAVDTGPNIVQQCRNT
jgi:hypothetical protein